jgi:hypothetical protein
MKMNAEGVILFSTIKIVVRYSPLVSNRLTSFAIFLNANVRKQKALSDVDKDV